MKRLTERIKRLQKDDLIVYINGKYEDTIPAEMTNDDIRAVLKKLAAYEDLEEQDLIVRLPANKNKEIYIISSRWTVCSKCGSRFGEYSCIGCEYECDSEKEYYVRPTYLSSINVDTYANQFEKTVFLTREEAEKKLEEKNGK